MDTGEKKSLVVRRNSGTPKSHPFLKVILPAIVSLICILTTSNSYAATIADWTFESSAPSTAGNFPAEFGLSSATSFASGSHASPSVVYSSPAGNGSNHSFNSSMWAVGDYYQLQSSTINFALSTVTWDQTSSATGPGNFLLQYSTDGINFTSYTGAYTAGAAVDGVTTVVFNGLPMQWNTISAYSAYNFGVDLSDIPALSNSSDVYFRLVDQTTAASNGGTVVSVGTDRIDNVIITGTPVPEPATFSILSVTSVAMQLRRRRIA